MIKILAQRAAPPDGGGGTVYPLQFKANAVCSNGTAALEVWALEGYGDTRFTVWVYSDASYTTQVGFWQGYIHEIALITGLADNTPYYLRANGDISTYATTRATTGTCLEPLFVYVDGLKPCSSYGASDGAITVRTTGGVGPYQFRIKPMLEPDTAYSAYQAELTFAGLAAGDYTVQATDSRGSLAIVSPKVTQPTYILLQLIVSDPAMEMHLAYGSVLTPEDTLYYWEYAWDPATETMLPEKAYTRLRKDAPTYNGLYTYLHPTPEDFYGYCVGIERRFWSYDTATRTATMHQQPAESCGWLCTGGIAFSSVNLTKATASGARDGAISALATSTAGGLQYSIGGPFQASGEFTGLSAGRYLLTARDAQLCKVEQWVDLAYQVPCTAQVLHVHLLGNNALVAAASPYPPLLYSFNGAMFTPDNQGACLPLGLNTVAVRDASGCEVSQAFTVADCGEDWEYRLVIDGEEHPIAEPLRFDKLEVELKRDKRWHGVNAEFSELTVDFDCAAGYDLIYAQYLLHGSDSDILFKAYLRESGCAYKLDYQARLNFSDYHNEGGKISLSLERAGLHVLLTNRSKSKIDLAGTVNLDGGPLELINPATATLHSKAIVKAYEATANDPYYSSELIENSQGKNDPYLVLGFGNITTQDLTTINTLQTGFSYTRQRYPIFEPTESGVYDIDFSADLLLRVRLVRGDFDRVRTRLYFQLNDEPATVLHDKTDGGVDGDFDSTTQNRNVRARVTRRLQLSPGDKVYFYGEVNVSDFSGNYQYTFECDLSETSYIKISGETTTTDTPTKSYPVFEAMAKVLSGVLGETNVLDSPLFGREDSYPRSYAFDGAAGNYLLASGFMVRGLQGKPFALSFLELMESLNPMFCIGYSVEAEGVREVVHVNSAASFYRDNVVMVFNEVSGYGETIASDMLYNQAAFGYETWQPEGRVENGLDEPCARREWQTPLKWSKKEYKQLSRFIAGAYLLEAQRRIGPVDEDSRHDNNTFIIAARRQEQSWFIRRYPSQTSLVTSFDPGEPWEAGQVFTIKGGDNAGRWTVAAVNYEYVWQSYPFPGLDIQAVLELTEPLRSTTAFDGLIMRPGVFVSEKNEAFAEVSGLYSPDTAYNLRITPARMFRAHAQFLNSAVFFKPLDALYRTTFGEGNEKLTTKFRETEEHTLGDPDRLRVGELYDVPIGELRRGDKLFEPLLLHFNTHLLPAQWDKVRANRHEAYVAWNGKEWVKGYIQEVIYRKKNGLTKFTLIKAGTAYDPALENTREFNAPEFNAKEFN